jgi:hypothetical protein
MYDTLTSVRRNIGAGSVIKFAPAREVAISAVRYKFGSYATAAMSLSAPIFHTMPKSDSALILPLYIPMKRQTGPAKATEEPV